MFILILEVVVIYTFAIDLTACTVGGISYMDPLITRRYHNGPLEDPCNPPYWYPRYIPEYCLEKNTKKPKPFAPLPIPIPVPHPVALAPINPIAMPIARPLPISGPLSVMASPGLPYQPLFSPYQQIGMVPGLPGIVSPDGGVNILPFSDAYSDLLEKHKRKILRRRMQKILRDYKRFS